MNPPVIAHFPDTFGVMHITSLVEPRLLQRADKAKVWVYAEVRLLHEGGQWREKEAVYHEPLKAKTKAAAERECTRVAVRRAAEAALTQPKTSESPPASDEARRVRERVLAQTKWGAVVTAIAAGDDAAAERLYKNIHAALFAAPSPDDRHEVVVFRKLFASRKKTFDWQLVIVAHWDRVKDMRHKDVDLLLARHGVRPYSPAAMKRFQQRVVIAQG